MTPLKKIIGQTVRTIFKDPLKEDKSLSQDSTPIGYSIHIKFDEYALTILNKTILNGVNSIKPRLCSGNYLC
jgi:hypothetical protein